ncbi:MAG: DUF7594 domain-containing protein, partial [Candidatus Binatia bacterium]
VEGCDPVAGCYRRPAVVCPDDGISCTTAGCREPAGTCVQTPNHAACDDGIFCDGVERCDLQAGCVAGTSVNCADAILCTADACDEAARACVHVPASAACDDGSTCTTDTCDPVLDCRHTDTCQPASVDLAPLADTYVEAGTEATWDHGGADHLDVDLSPLGVAYVKFDLSGVTAPVVRATLRVFCSNSSNDGGTVYPVGSSTWIEGDRSGLDAGSAGGPGLKWTDVDRNRNGKLDAGESPYVPDFTHALGRFGPVVKGHASTAALDVTAAFAGPGPLYTLAIRSNSTDGATFASRGHDQGPLLHLDLRPPGGP